MRHLLGFISLFMFATVMGCGGSSDEVLDYDPELSKQKSAEYAAQQKAGLENAMKQMKKGNQGNPYKRR